MRTLFQFSGIILIAIAVTASSYVATDEPQNPSNMQQATFGAGCFWCVEAIFERLEGVYNVESGYSGGHADNPGYQQVTSGRTGHAEVIRFDFDPDIISYEQLLEVFWHTHDPTTLNRQGADVGTQYRSVIFYHDESQKNTALASRERTDASGLWTDPIVTEISPLINYYVAENYHQDYFNNNPNAGYCSVVIAPKVRKFMREFSHLLKN
ncbi:MAG: peptide-methionine (S)-S-oxide reductase MsrA [Bacteroidetes bacterium HLUCCA01]|nr:MAG: peptide-methionine (S)-S-oxide reductase MsrA [Bacteroidetes bacterium HLUCCA01]